MMPSLLLLVWTAPLALAEVPQGPASEPTAADIERAKQLFDNGFDLYEEASYRDAIAAWSEAYRLSGKPDLLYNIANAHERLAEYDEAIEAISTYRAFATPEERELLDRRMRNLEKLLLEQEQRAAPAPEPAPEPVVGVPEPVPPPRTGSGRRVASIVLLGAGGIGLGSAGVLGLLSDAAGRRASDQCVDGLCPDSVAPDLQANRSLALWSDVSLAAGLATAGVGVGLVVTASPRGVAVTGSF